MTDLTVDFVNWDRTASRPTGGAQVERGKRSPPATDLHVFFRKGGVTLGATKPDVHSAKPVSTELNGYEFTFPLGGSLESAPYLQPSTVNRHGALIPPVPPEKLPKGSTVRITFKGTGTEVPEITRWYWTYDDPKVPRQEFRGDPDTLPSPPRGARKAR
jgi:hypothetical protein